VEAKRLSREKGLGWTLYGWEGDRLAWESRDGESIHYFYEPNAFVPIAQGVQNHSVLLHKRPDWTGKTYKFSEDPLWQLHPEAKPFARLAFYHCDQIGTPQEMTDEKGNIVWSATYKAWGEARITVKEGYKNPLRFQGQYFDHETGLHYNRYRYYDPKIGRFISKDPIGLAGGLNPHVYAPNPVVWVDPLGLQKSSTPHIENIENKINEIREDGYGVRIGGANVQLGVGKVQVGDPSIWNKSTRILSKSIGIPCRENEIGVGTKKLSFLTKTSNWIKQAFGGKVSVSTTAVSVSANVACVDPVKVVNRVAAEGTDIIINSPVGTNASILSHKSRDAIEATGE
jgi:RHS repeat-associated protein